jgi:hypothetical protein
MLVQLLVGLIILGLIFWAVGYLTPVLHIPPLVQRIVYVVLVVLAVLWLLSVFGWVSTPALLR